MPKTIIGVRLKDKDTGEFSGRVYSYYCMLNVRKGDLIKAPTKYGDAVGQVVETEIPDSKIDERIMPLLKTITEYADGQICMSDR